jgi:hypothetical protein
MNLPIAPDGMFVDVPATISGTGGATLPFTMEELGFTTWPADRGALAFSPGNIPAWLQEQVCHCSLLVGCDGCDRTA